ncbi:carboxypeptidase-like regulatory domain-containing protein [Acaryochloris sp. CCMEE 5410]|uniref:carboxypeptidase-like regulatory domain-containing protein n=1 Tax=Acaryochloris sp. CCMEE 5410 TaxID=310037 RepID=UPI0002483E2B|nr:carboxypeptidase-like regulatory domain-containing protein [Acaryochloris sp. CCMEE 5410]KAI9129341.1 carboxypeptidase regulatory-like domain-containing protein [Acaryochloris sp. CCMEE 5410]KAI9129567.1 carboxypeptidase regulatory-like domain-containing protein [Acaryochloris sp. CCMEE 5410]
MNRRWAPILGLWVNLWVTPAILAHGIVVDYRVTPGTVEIEAAFESGEPMANAQVTVYTPDHAAEPWLTATADEEGHFTFSPPADQKGTWQIKVQQAGHGKILNIPVNETSSGTAGAKPFSPLVQNVISVIVIGGSILTAILLFSKRKQ